MKTNLITMLILSVLSLACQKKDKASDYDFPNPVDTTDKPITEQEKKEYLFDGVYFDNRFDGARLNDVSLKDDSVYQLIIRPENEPINRSPWYAFQISADTIRNVYLQLEYGSYKHRYHPKISRDGKSWELVDTTSFSYNTDSTSLTFPVSIDSSKLWISAQELFTTGDLAAWAEAMSSVPVVHQNVIGKSRKGRDLVLLDIYNKSKKDKNLIIIFSRQHPPEVTGFYAMQAFVEAIAQSGNDTGFLDTYRILVYPMLNPDGVDMGHWRHNAGGIDLNRDWAYYNQSEVRQIADHVVKESYENESKVVLGFDFHSTYKDVYYTQSVEEQKTPTTPWFRRQWFKALEGNIPGYKVNDKPAGLGSPVTKGWFYTQFGAEAMTYEIGDKTPRDSIRIFGTIAAEQMINVLLKNQTKL